MKPPCIPTKTETNSHRIKTTVESPNKNNESNHVEQCRITTQCHSTGKINSNKKESCNDGNVDLKKVIINYDKYIV